MEGWLLTWRNGLKVQASHGISWASYVDCCSLLAWIFPLEGTELVNDHGGKAAFLQAFKVLTELITQSVTKLLSGSWAAIQ